MSAEDAERTFQALPVEVQKCLRSQLAHGGLEGIASVDMHAAEPDEDHVSVVVVTVRDELAGTSFARPARKAVDVP